MKNTLVPIKPNVLVVETQTIHKETGITSREVLAFHQQCLRDIVNLMKTVIVSVMIILIILVVTVQGGSEHLANILKALASLM